MNRLHKGVTPGRVLAYAVLILIGIGGIAPFLDLAVLSHQAADRDCRTGAAEPGLQVGPDRQELPRGAVGSGHGQLYPEFAVRGVGRDLSCGADRGSGGLGLFAADVSRVRGGLASFILSMRFMPPIAVAIPLFIMVKTAGLQDTYAGLILPYVAFSLPLVVWIMIGFFDEVPREIDEAAAIDGASRWRILTRVHLPVVWPGIMTSALFGALFIWNEFLVALYVVNSRAIQPISLGAATLVSAQRPVDWNIAAAVGVVTVIPILIFSLFVQRYIVRGLTAGAVK